MSLTKTKKIIKNLINSITGRKLFRKTLPPLHNINKILVISLYFRGDFLFHTAFIEALKTLFPNSFIDIWIKNRLEDIIYNDQRFSEILLFNDIKTASYNESTKLNINSKLQFLRKLRFKKYDVIFDLTGKYSTALFTLFSAPKYSVGINYNYFGFCYDKFVNLNTSTEKGHLIEKYLSVLPIGLNLSDAVWDKINGNLQQKPYIFIDDSVKIFIDKIIKRIIINNNKPLITLHATSGWKAKEMDSSIFAELIRHFISKNYNYTFIGDAGDKKKLEEIKSFLNESEFDDNQNFLELKFIQSVELIRRSDLFIGSDSAPLHAAGAVGTPSIGIFGPTNPDFSKPVGDIHKVIYRRLYCSASDDMQYCTRNAGFTCPTIDCMKLITANEIIEMIESLLVNFSVKKK